jgi:hypothetical protein
MGLLTTDVTPLGVVVTGDSQPIELRERAFTILPTRGARRRPCFVAHAGSDFTAALGFVGTEKIGDSPTRHWLERFSERSPALTLDRFCDGLAHALTIEWSRNSYDTCLWIFISGASQQEPVFRAVRNCGPEMDHSLLYTQIGPDFVWHDDLANHMATYGASEESRLETLAHHTALYRNGILLPGALVLGSFQTLMQQLLSGAFQDFAQVSTLAAYASIVKMRGEFLKRLFDEEKGVYDSDSRPIAGALYVWRVELDGSIYDHSGKKPSQVAAK